MNHIKLFENWLNESSNDWMTMVMDACGDFEHKYPQGLAKICSATPDQIMDNAELQELYNEAAKCIVEPDQAVKDFHADLGDYYDRCEREGFGFVKNVIRELPSDNTDKWFCVIDLIEEIGY
jgi:hypothetical protein